MKGILCHVKCHWGNVNAIQAWPPTTEIYNMAGKHWLNTISLLSGDAVRRSSLRCAPFGPPTVSCVLAPARTCLRQAPPTSRGRGLATSAVPHHLTDDMAMKTFTTGKRCKKTSFFSPFQKIQTNGVKSGRFLHRLVRSRGCLGEASGQVLHGHLHDTDRITLKISHLNRWQYSKRFRQHGHRRRLIYCVSVSGVKPVVGTAPHWFLQ